MANMIQQYQKSMSDYAVLKQKAKEQMSQLQQVKLENEQLVLKYNRSGYVFKNKFQQDHVSSVMSSFD